MNEAAFRALIREIIQDELEEISTSAAAGPYDTPFAFAGNDEDSKKKRRKNSDQAGYTMIEGRSVYQEFKNDPSHSNVQKIGKTLAAISKELLAAEKALGLCVRLKAETNTDNSQLWKRTQNVLNKMQAKMVQLTHKIQELKK